MTNKKFAKVNSWNNANNSSISLFAHAFVSFEHEADKYYDENHGFVLRKIRRDS